MDDLIYSFLLQSDFPRAAIIIDLDQLGATAKVGSDMRRPSFVIVDPDTAELLAIIDVVDAIDGDALRQMSIETGAYASRLGGKAIQGFVIRVDVRGRTEEEQIQFYRVWPNSTLHQLTSKSFPDLGSLRVARKLVLENTPRPVINAEPVIMEEEEEYDEVLAIQRPGIGLFLPAIVLLILIAADIFSTISRGTALWTVAQCVLASGAAFLFSLPAAIRYLRR